VHARPRAGVARGIVRGCTEGLEGEVTVREAVGAGCSRWASTAVSWRCLGRHGVCWVGLYEVGVGLGGQQGGARPLGVYGGGGDRREGVLAGWPRAPPLPLDAK
jgi:hypothetical protein